MITIFEMDFSLVGIIVATVVGMIVGAMWYGPVFGKKWMSMEGVSEEYVNDKSNMGLLYGVAALASLTQAVAIALLKSLLTYGTEEVLSLVGLVALLWVFLYLLPQLNNALFANRGWRIVLLNTGQNFVLLIIQALILIYI